MIILSETTTLQLPKKLKQELDQFKDYRRESYADIIRKLVSLAKAAEEEKLELSQETLNSIRMAREDLRRGRLFSSRQAKKHLGL